MKSTLIVVLLVASAAWAELPDSVSLEEAVAHAKDTQPTLRQARAVSEAAVARTEQSFAPILPTVTAQLAYRRATGNFVAQQGTVSSNTSSTATTTSVITFNSYDYFSGSLIASATLWDFLQNWNRYKASLSIADAQAAQVHAAEVAAILNVRTAWHTARAQKDLVAVAKATLANTEAHLQQIQGFVTVGTRPEIDLAQSKSERANARLSLVNATNNYSVARARLNQAMGIEGPVTYDVVGDPAIPVEGEEKTADGLLQEALTSRPEAVALEGQVKAQDYLNRATRGAYLPTLSAVVSGTVAAPSLDKPVPNMSGQLVLNWPIFQGGLTNGQLREGEAVLRQLEAQRDGLRLQVRLDVETAVLGVAAAKEAVEVAGEAVDAARERLRLAEGRYRAGAGSSIELGDAQIASTSAEAQVVQAKANLAIARSQLIASLGRL